MKRLLIPLLLLTASTAFAAESRLDQTVLNNFVTAQHELKTQLTQMCDGHKADPDPALQQAIVSWFAVQALQLPATEFMQTNFVYVFWPDSKDRLKKQVRAATLLTPKSQTWDSLPASVKSLSAIEFLLQTDEPTEYCDWYSAITDYQINQASQLQNLQEFYDFGETERLTALHGTALTLHMVLKEVLSRPGKAQWILGPGWRSDSGVPVVQGLAKQASDLLQTFEGTHDDIDTWLSVTETYAPISQQASIEQLSQWNLYGENLANFVEKQLAPALDIYIGFNNFDGD